MTDRTDTLIIGASAAGLATAVGLTERGRQFEILEASDAVAASWRRHYDRLHLHTPKSASALPGLKMPAEWPRYVERQQVIEYLERYQSLHGLKPHFGQPVTRLERQGGEWVATTPTTQWRARTVVVATGANRQPALAVHSRAGHRDPWQATGLLVLTVRGNRIAAVTRFEPDGRFDQRLETGLRTRDNNTDMSAR